MSQHHVGCRIPPEWHNQILTIQQETGQSESEILREAIALYLKRAKVPKVRSRIDALEERLNRLTALIMQQ